MSIEKQAAFTDTLAKAIGKRVNAASNEVRRAARVHDLAAKDPGFSFTRMAIDGLEANDAFGAPTLRKGYEALQKGISMIDTGAGAFLRGKAKPGDLLYSMFTDKRKIPVNRSIFGKAVDKVLGRSSELYRVENVASISKPVKAVGSVVVPVMAYSKWDDISQKLRSKPKEEAY